MSRKLMIMKKTIVTLLLFSSLALSQGCKPYNVIAFTQDEVYGSSCPSPTYITTMYFTGSIKNIKDENGFESLRLVASEEDFTLSNLLKMAKEKHGQDVTISNIRWDVKGKKQKKVGVVFDVIKCR
jgi:hypothetical protein